MLSAFCYFTLNLLLLPYSIEYGETGKMTAGNFLYAAIGLLFSPPTPFVAVLIISLFIEKIGIKQMLRNIFRTENKPKTILITGGFCLLALVYAILFGISNGSPWYMFPPGFLIMIPFVGIAEENGWRGYYSRNWTKGCRIRLRLSLSELFGSSGIFLFIYIRLQTIKETVSLDLGSLFIWVFALTAIRKSTKSVIA